MAWPWNFILFVGIAAVVVIIMDILCSTDYEPGRGAGTPMVEDDDDLKR